MQTKTILICFIFCFGPVAFANAQREWEPLSPRDYWIDVGLAAGAFSAYALIPKQNGDLGHSNFIDDAGRSAFRLSSAGQRHDAHLWSNALLTGVIALPVALDPALTWGRDHNPRSAARISNINAQAFGLTAVLTGTTKALVGRERPYVTTCRRNPQSDPGCRDLDNDESLKSFYSGHSVYAFTAAGLTCLHHTELHLYGDARDSLACGSAIGLATAVAVARVAADKHFVTDVSSAALIGLFSGYIFPRWLHEARPEGADALGSAKISGQWLPLASDESLGFAYLRPF